MCQYTKSFFIQRSHIWKINQRRLLVCIKKTRVRSRLHERRKHCQTHVIFQDPPHLKTENLAQMVRHETEHGAEFARTKSGVLTWLYFSVKFKLLTSPQSICESGNLRVKGKISGLSCFFECPPICQSTISNYHGLVCYLFEMYVKWNAYLVMRIRNEVLLLSFKF